MIAKFIDDFMMAGGLMEKNELKETISRHLKTNYIIVDGELLFNGWVITQDRDGNITVDVKENIKQRIALIFRTIGRHSKGTTLRFRKSATIEGWLERCCGIAAVFYVKVSSSDR